MSFQDTQSVMPINKQDEYQPQPYILREDEKIPLFLIKLWNIVEDPAYYEVIRWDESGYSFHITDPYSFCRNVLPQFFKHNNLNSLIRQLNMYGFRKMTPIERTSLARAESDQDHLEFSHPYFVRDHPELLINIKRKVPSSKQPTHQEAPTTVNVPAKDLSLVFEELRQLRDRQKNMEYKMNELVKENELIWQEMDHVRGAHLKQQQIVNKLVQFLVSLVQPNKQQRLGKRQLLAIDEFQAKRSRDSDGGSNANGGGGGGTSRMDDVLGALSNNNSNGTSQFPSASAQINANEVLDSLISELASGGVFNVLPHGSVISTSNGPIIADVTDELDQLHCANNNADNSGMTGGEPNCGQHQTHSQHRQSPVQPSYSSMRSQRAPSMEAQLPTVQTLRGGGIQLQQQSPRGIPPRANSITQRHAMSSGRGSTNVKDGSGGPPMSRRGGGVSQPSAQESNLLMMQSTRGNDGRYRYSRQQQTRQIGGNERVLSSLPLQISSQPSQLQQQDMQESVPQTQIVSLNQQQQQRYSQRPQQSISAAQAYQPQYQRVAAVIQPQQPQKQYILQQPQPIQQQQTAVEPPQICYMGSSVTSPQQPSPQQPASVASQQRPRSSHGCDGTSPVVMSPPSHEAVQNQPQQLTAQNVSGNEAQLLMGPGQYAGSSGTMTLNAAEGANVMMNSSLSTPQPSTNTNQAGGPTVTFEDSPRDFSEYLSSMDQSISQCRDDIANHWDLNLLDEIDPQEWQDLFMDDIGGGNASQYSNPTVVEQQQQPTATQSMEELSPLLNVPVDTPVKRQSNAGK